MYPINYHSNHKFFAFLILKKFGAPERRRDKKRSLNFHFITFKLHFKGSLIHCIFKFFKCPGCLWTVMEYIVPFLEDTFGIIYTSIWLNYISYESCSGWATKNHIVTTNNQRNKSNYTWPSGLFLVLLVQ